MTKKEFTDHLFKAMYESGYRKAEIVKGRVFFYKENSLMGVWSPRIPIECTCFADKYQCIDICEYLGIIDWNKVEVDMPILVSDDGIDWRKRYFALFEDGIIYAWESGATSWSSEDKGRVVSWKYAKLAGDRT